ncbi:MAG: hypothetical protein U0M60_19850 [Clostridia bacterium]|nr:hypothetical protein [Clostridia bacterium]
MTYMCIKNTNTISFSIYSRNVKSPTRNFTLKVDQKSSKPQNASPALLAIEAQGIADGCLSPERICRNYVVSGPQVQKNRIKVILVNKNLGY